MMSTLEELKDMWQKKAAAGTDARYTEASLTKIIRRRVRKQTAASMNYFWASFTLQLIVYALLSHVILRYGDSPLVLYFAIPGILLFIPFTVVLMRKFKKLATGKSLMQQNVEASLHDYVFRQKALLGSFYHFKKWYEFFLIPLSCAIGVALVFELYVPGGVLEHGWGAAITFILSLGSCMAAIYRENKKSFILPMERLQIILEEFKQGE